MPYDERGIPLKVSSTEGDGDDDHVVPPDLLFLYEVIEWLEAVTSADP